MPADEVAFNAIPADDFLEIATLRGLLHTIDGWSYFGRSISALLAGDAHAARHLAYYAELRAALSMLSNCGVEIFNRQNRVIDSAGQVHSLEKQPTHQMCWAALEHWAALPGSLELMLRSVKVNGVPLYDALKDFFPGASVVQLGGQLIWEWGFDLQRGAADRNERNASSYHLNALSPLGNRVSDDIDFVDGLWRCFEPSNWVFEKHLLRKLLELEHSVVGGDPISVRRREYQRLDARLSAVVSHNFLSRTEDGNDHSVFRFASDESAPAPAYSMISRAAVLLKLSMSVVEANLEDASVSALDDLAFWWSPFGVERGFWRPGAEPQTMEDLWQDVQIALEDSAAAVNPYRHSWIEALTASSSRLCEAERIALWTLCC
jgi:hypothetical protein